MNYRLIVKDPANQPSVGIYSDWKEQIADECFKQCVYCTICEGVWGGIDHYHIDHYRPKSIVRFSGLINDICNLFYACPICNRFKSNDWPNDPTSLDEISYPDPSQIDYETIFEEDTSNFTIRSKYRSGTYVIERLYLNRPQLIYYRREQHLNKIGENLLDEVTSLANIFTPQNPDDIELLKSALTLIAEIAKHLIERGTIRPYKLMEIRKVE